MATNSPVTKRYVLAPTTYPWKEFDTAEEAVEVAIDRIKKNQRLYGLSRADMVYAICRVEAYVRPVRPVTDIEIIRAEDNKLDVPVPEDHRDD